MSVRNKIIIIIVPLMLISVIAVSLVSGVFFSRYLESEERAQMIFAGESASSYVNGQQSKYQLNANKWGHWDDTYNFMQGDSAYIDSNLTEESFKNLDVNFIIYMYHGDWIYFQKYNDLKTGDFIDFDSDFMKDF